MLTKLQKDTLRELANLLGQELESASFLQYMVDEYPPVNGSGDQEQLTHNVSLDGDIARIQEFEVREVNT